MTLRPASTSSAVATRPARPAPTTMTSASMTQIVSYAVVHQGGQGVSYHRIQRETPLSVTVKCLLYRALMGLDSALTFIVGRKTIMAVDFKSLDRNTQGALGAGVLA